MAKSMRSKVKRSFRSKKRETGVYAATEAARLNRLNSKLVTAKDKREETLAEEGDGMELLGWSRLPIFGLLDQSDITTESMGKFMAGEGCICGSACNLSHLEDLRWSLDD